WWLLLMLACIGGAWLRWHMESRGLSSINYLSIRKGMTEHDVIQILGEPSNRQIVSPLRDLDFWRPDREIGIRVRFQGDRVVVKGWMCKPDLGWWRQTLFFIESLFPY